MPVKARFQLDRLPRALKKDLRASMSKFTAKDPGQYWCTTIGATGRRYYVRHETGVPERLLNSDGTIVGLRDTVIQPVSDDLNEALILNDAAAIRNWEIIRDVAAHVAEGHYTPGIVERLRRLCEHNQLHEAEAILASVPPRDARGPLVTWVEHSLRAFTDAHMSLIVARMEIIRAAEAKGGEL